LKEFSDWLLEAGDGKSGATISLPPYCFSNTQDSVEQLYSDINFNDVTAQQLQGIANEDSLELHSKVLNRMPGEDTVYKRVDTVASQEPSDHLAPPEAFCNSLIPTGMSPH
jgi:hypothetical protein